MSQIIFVQLEMRKGIFVLLVFFREQQYLLMTKSCCVVCYDNGHIMLIFGFTFSTLLWDCTAVLIILDKDISQTSKLWHFSQFAVASLDPKLLLLLLWGWLSLPKWRLNFNGMRSRPDAGHTSQKWVGWPAKYSIKCKLVLYV